MDVSSKPRLSLREKADLWFQLLVLAPPKLGFYSMQNLLFAHSRGLSFNHFFTCAKVKVLLAFSGPQIQSLLPTCLDAYRSWIASKRKQYKDDQAVLARLDVDTQPIPGRRANIFWIGNRASAKKVVFFLHGGGYLLPITDVYCTICWNTFLQPLIEASGNGGQEEVAVAMLQYELTPGAKFPSQLHDAAAALPLLFEQGFQPRDIIVGGDSAGGNLTMLLLHHLVKPHPDIQPVKMEEPFAGAFVASPWLGTDYDTPSCRNNTHDMLSLKILNTNARVQFTDQTWEGIAKAREGGSRDAWAMNPFGVEESWLSDLASVTARLYISAGTEELLLDASLDLAEKLKRVGSAVDVELDVQHGEAHDWLLVEGSAGEIGGATRRLKSWVSRAMEG